MSEKTNLATLPVYVLSIETGLLRPRPPGAEPRAMFRAVVLVLKTGEKLEIEGDMPCPDAIMGAFEARATLELRFDAVTKLGLSPL